MADSHPSSAGRSAITGLRARRPVILPSLLLCDFGNLEREVQALEQAGVAALHLDVMDGQFVPNLTYGLPVVAALRRLTKLPLDVHLMIQTPERLLEDFAQAGADGLTIHVEATEAPAELLRTIRRLGLAAGLAINPPTPLARVSHLLSECDLLLVMSVMPGFGGQKFDPVALDKLRELRKTAPAELLLEVDGGVNASTIAPCATSGADLLVVGSAIFQAPDYTQAVSDLRRRTGA